MQGMNLVGVLIFLAFKRGIQGDLIGLVDNRALACRHFSDMKVCYAGNRFEIFFGSRKHFLNCVRFVRIGPKYDYM